MNKQMKIMVVDDDSTFLFIFKKQMEKDPSFKIIKEAVHGDDAITYLSGLTDKTDYPDLIVLDINMPVMDGWQFLDAFSELNKSMNIKIPVCMLSSTINQIDFDKSKTYRSVKHFFTKPLTTIAMGKMKELHQTVLARRAAV